MWHSLNLSSHMLVPGPEGPLASTRYEVLREGIQEAETRVAIEKVLTDEARKAKLGAEMADRAQKFLDDRLRDVFRSGSSLGLSGRDYASSRITGDSWGGLAGHCWYLSSGWEAKNWAFYNLAAEVTAKAGAK